LWCNALWILRLSGHCNFSADDEDTTLPFPRQA
jgi:hypothetical protein